MTSSNKSINLSIVAAAHNEEENLTALVEEIVAAISPTDDSFEIIIVDDGSTDGSGKLLEKLMIQYPQLRSIKMLNTPPGKGNGQSAAFYAGFRAANGKLVIPLDADLQNDPADIPAMVELLHSSNADLIQGDRSADRQDTFVKRVTSIIGRMSRKVLLKDSIRDTGCSLRVMKREVALALPLEFKGMHRFIPGTARQLGYTVVETPVRHRPRIAGTTKYGIANRAIPGLIDCFATRWMHNRRRPTAASELEAASSNPIKHRQEPTKQEATT
ncbi:MAG: glycosyltransferase family 2 protein [Planctomycetes bacterium]|nr:glycosyltransferase family 2 protein [Planctomycetota bacterium]